MKANVINLYKHFCDLIDNPTGADELERNFVKENAIKSKKNLEDHFRSANKYRGDPDIQKILGFKPLEKKPKEEIKKEIKTDGKKSKR